MQVDPFTIIPINKSHRFYSQVQILAALKARKRIYKKLKLSSIKRKIKCNSCLIHLKYSAIRQRRYSQRSEYQCQKSYKTFLIKCSKTKHSPPRLIKLKTYHQLQQHLISLKYKIRLYRPRNQRANPKNRGTKIYKSLAHPQIINSTRILAYFHLLKIVQLSIKTHKTRAK